VTCAVLRNRSLAAAPSIPAVAVACRIVCVKLLGMLSKVQAPLVGEQVAQLMHCCFQVCLRELPAPHRTIETP
jgi:hypothetical protein